MVTIKSTEPRDQNLGITSYDSRLYTEMLGRGFYVNSLHKWCQKILDDPTIGKALSVTLNGFMHSQEFINKGLSDVEFVKVCCLLGREYDEAGLKDWVGRLAKGTTRNKVAASFANSKEFANLMARYGLK